MSPNKDNPMDKKINDMLTSRRLHLTLQISKHEKAIELLHKEMKMIDLQMDCKDHEFFYSSGYVYGFNTCIHCGFELPE